MDLPNLISNSSANPGDEDIGSGPVQDNDRLAIPSEMRNAVNVENGDSVWERVKTKGSQLKNGVEQACIIL